MKSLHEIKRNRTKSPSINPLIIREEHMLATSTAPVSASASPTFEEMEPVLAIHEIQGNSLAGFHKDHEMLMFLQISDVAIAKQWLRTLEPYIATTAEVLQFNRLFKETRQRRHGREGTVRSTFINIGFSFEGLKKLTAEAEQFTDESFKAGLHNRSAALGDPTDVKSPGHPLNWLIGGPNNVPDVVLIVASDDRSRLDEEVKWLTKSLPTGIRLMFKQRGETLPGALAGHEHFGFKDGISQPGIRGRLSDAKDDFLTHREDPKKHPNQGKIGQDLLHPGEFIFGYHKQIGQPDVDANGQEIDGLNVKPGEIATAGPAWSVNGSYLVFRRLNQDVKGFRAFLKSAAAKLAAENPAFADMTADKLGAKLVGRWKNGTPVTKSPDREDPKLANDLDFEFEDEDGKGFRCPFAGHIRKTYPRDTQRGTFVNESATQTRRLLRRGIPFGKAMMSGCPMKALSIKGLKSTFQGMMAKREDRDRGLLFLAYQTSITGQFEFVTNLWANNPGFSDENSGHDAIIGQSEDATTRDRSITLQAPGQNSEVKLLTDWVVPTGGGYFFTPSISALKHLAQ
jgi:Dyp-type peroxidase family